MIESPFDKPDEKHIVNTIPIKETNIVEADLQKKVNLLEEELKKMTITVKGDLEIEGRYVIFSDGLMATMQKTFYKTKDKYVFYLYPTKSLEVQYRLADKRKQDRDYIEAEDVYVKEYPIEICHCINLHPVFQRWWVFSTWNGDFLDPFDKFNAELMNRVLRLQKERDGLKEMLNSMGRSMQEQGKYPQASQQQMIEMVERLVSKLTQRPSERV